MPESENEYGTVSENGVFTSDPNRLNNSILYKETSASKNKHSFPLFWE